MYQTTTRSDIVHIRLMPDDARLLSLMVTADLGRIGLSLEQRSVLLSVSCQLLQGLRRQEDERLAAR
jgi:hypothetical protein